MNATFTALFTCVDRRVSAVREKTSSRTTTRWRGRFAGVDLVLTITPRTRVAGEQFLTSSSHRLGGSHVGSWGHFLDVVADVDLPPELRDQLAALVSQADETHRRARVRVRSERLVSGVGQDRCA